MNSRSVPKTEICSPPLASSPGCLENPVTTVCPTVSGTLDSACSLEVRTMMLPPLTSMPEGALTRIMSLPTISKSVTFWPPGNSISVTSMNPEPLMVIGWLVTTFVGKNVLMPSPTLAVSASSSAQDVNAVPMRTTATNALKYFIICFITFNFSILQFFNSSRITNQDSV